MLFTEALRNFSKLIVLDISMLKSIEPSEIFLSLLLYNSRKSAVMGGSLTAPIAGFVWLKEIEQQMKAVIQKNLILLMYIGFTAKFVNSEIYVRIA